MAVNDKVVQFVGSTDELSKDASSILAEESTHSSDTRSMCSVKEIQMLVTATVWLLVTSQYTFLPFADPDECKRILVAINYNGKCIKTEIVLTAKP